MVVAAVAVAVVVVVVGLAAPMRRVAGGSMATGQVGRSRPVAMVVVMVVVLAAQQARAEPAQE